MAVPPVPPEQRAHRSGNRDHGELCVIGQLTARRGALAIIGCVNAPRPDLSKMPERRSLILDGRTWAEVSIGALGENFHAIQKHVGEGVTICAVVKADGYGHGAVECARALESDRSDPKLWLLYSFALKSAGREDEALSTMNDAYEAYIRAGKPDELREVFADVQSTTQRPCRQRMAQ